MGEKYVTREQIRKNAPGEIEENRQVLIALFDELRSARDLSPTRVSRLIERHTSLRRESIIEAYRQLTAVGFVPFERRVYDQLRLRPVRTISGVAPMAVLTGPYPCPADCIFCPEAKGFPRSYLPEEPGAQRAKLAHFDPFRQIEMRLQSLEINGHPTDKIELLILGATWSAYPKKYQEWFIRRCLDAMNGRDSSTLLEAQRANETAPHRNVGLVIETRPDYITMDEVRRLRYLGVTKVQLGVQSLDDKILAKNQRGHTVYDARRAIRLLRLAGLKLHLHWMPNLLGATPQSDREDFARLWDDTAFRPDELKIYPCALIQGTMLYPYYERGEYRPYGDDELVDLLIACKAMVPSYCRINRIVRDIPANYIAAGSTQSHMRQVVQREMRKRGIRCQCIRCREVRAQKLDVGDWKLEIRKYDTDATSEYFLSYESSLGKLAGFLRLSLPGADAPREEILDELHGSAVIREVHVYGPALEIGAESEGEAQHSGLGTRLIEEAMRTARHAGYKRIAVISATGTRDYYRKQGFELGELYMTRGLSIEDGITYSQAQDTPR
jgi:elongator complex protein 3 (tRNA carboxymethyluridine synthase)